MRIDLTHSSLTTRLAAREELAYWISRLSNASSGLIVVDFGDKLATGSWIDGFVVGLMHHIEEGLSESRLLIISSYEDTRDHLSLVLEKRGLAAFVVQKIEDLAAGNVQVFGQIAAAGKEVLAVIQRFGEASVHDIADAVGASIEATQQRLNALMEQRLITRAKLGRAYLYALPVMQSTDELVPALN